MRLDHHRVQWRPSFGACLAVVLVCTGATRCVAAMQTITTTYQYNADGARTAVTTQVDSQPATTTYLTWDNFVPNADAPSSGTVSAADGNLLGLGLSPGTNGLTTQLAYDVRDRLTSCTITGRSAASYAYHPNSLMASSTLASGDALEFYYDDNALALMANTRQPSTGLVSSFLGPVRYVSDGSEQVLLLPRKDTNGVYDPSAQTLSSYSYDPYGFGDEAFSDRKIEGSRDQGIKGSRADGATSYDLQQNPFQYAGEYKDPTCGAYYLRARWYFPTEQTFLSRDPADPLHRYSYTAGNPIGRTDPSGLKFTAVDFSRSVDKAVGKLEPGAWAWVEPILPVWGQVMGGIELLGALPTFWHHPTAEGWVNFGLLSASILFEAGAEMRSFDRLAGTAAFRLRLAGDVILGGSQTLAQSYRHGRLDVPTLIQGIETTVMGMVWARGFGGVGYRPHNLTAGDVDRMATDLGPDALNRMTNKALVYAVREKGGYTTPWREFRATGTYHEYVAAIYRGRDAYPYYATSDLRDYTFENLAYQEVTAPAVTRTRGKIWTTAAAQIPKGSSLRFIGAFDRDATETVMTQANPLRVLTRDELQRMIENGRESPGAIASKFSGNAHAHVDGIISRLQNMRRQ